MTVNDKLLCQHAVTELVKNEHISGAAVTLAWEGACRGASSVRSWVKQFEDRKHGHHN
jgi:hypothetical protein